LQLPKWNAIAISIRLPSLKGTAILALSSHRRIVRSQFSICAPFSIDPPPPFHHARRAAFPGFSQECHVTAKEEQEAHRNPLEYRSR